MFKQYQRIFRKTRRALIRFKYTRSIPKQDRGYPKVFCIGYLKTGTTSFGVAMIRLGFKHCKFDKEINQWYKNGQIERILNHARYFESFDDLPWNKVDLIFQLDKRFPRSKFVLLLRDESAWLKSFQKHRIEFNRPKVLSKKAIASYQMRNKKLKEYFKNRENQFLIMDITAGDGYEKLCPFLGLPVLNEPFPHVNKSQKKTNDLLFS